MHLQQQVMALQQQNDAAQQQLRTIKHENETLAERNRALEFQLKSYEQMFRSPKTEATSPQPMVTIPKTQEKKVLPGLRVFCDEVAAIGPEPAAIVEPPHTGSSQAFTNSFSFSFRSTPPTTSPSSPVCQSSSHPSPLLRRESFPSSP
jgi:regulator of replication initiation timing